MRKGFTLIELLVVIAIIGLLASIVTVSLSSSQDRAKQAKIESFAAQVHHALAADAVGIWDFDDAAAGTANDTSGLKNNGVFPGGSSNPTSSTDRYENANRAYSFDGGDYIDLGTPAALSFSSKRITISTWIKPTLLTGNRFIIEVGNPNGWGVKLVDGAIHFGFHNGWTSWTTDTPVIVGKWQHIVVVGGDGQKIQIYVNGNVDNNLTNNDPPLFTHWTLTNGGGNAKIGVKADLSVAERFNGSIDDVHVYKSALSSAQIQQLYAEGLGGHSLAQE